MEPREIVEECKRRKIWIFEREHFDGVWLFAPDDEQSSVPDWLRIAADECGRRLLDYMAYEDDAIPLMKEADKRLNSICRSKRLRKSALWERYLEKVEEAYLAEDIERLRTVLDEREAHVIAIFGDARERRRRRYYRDKYGY